MEFSPYADLAAIRSAMETVRQLRPQLEELAASIELQRPHFESMNRLVAQTASELAINYRSAAQLAGSYRPAAEVALAHHRSTLDAIASLLTNKDIQELLSQRSRWMEQWTANRDLARHAQEVATFMRPAALAWQVQAIAGLGADVIEEWNGSGESLECEVLSEVTDQATPAELVKLVGEVLVSGVSFPLDTKRARTKATIALLYFILSLIYTLRSAWSALRSDAELDRLRLEQRAMSEAIANLKATFHELWVSAADSKPSTLLTYRVAKVAVLRAGPGSETGRVGRLAVGTRVRLLASDGR